MSIVSVSTKTVINYAPVTGVIADPGSDSIAIATISDGYGESFSLTQTAGAGSLSETVSKGVATIYYTPPSTTALASDSVSYTVVGAYSGTTATETQSIAFGAPVASVPVTQVTVESGQTTPIAKFTPATGGTLQIVALDDASAAALNATTNPDGSLSVSYTAPASLAASGTVTLNYAVGDTDGTGLKSYSTTVQLDKGPTLTQITPTGTVENTSSIVIGSVALGLATDTLSVTGYTASSGVVSLGAVVNGSQQVIYTGNRSANATDNVTYTVGDELGGSVSGTSTIAIDKGAVVTSAGHEVIKQGATNVLVDTIVAGLPGDVLTLVQTSAGHGTLTLVANGTDASGDNKYNVLYTETGAFSSTITRDTAQFQVTDRAGGKIAGDTPNITLDSGPKVTSIASVKAAPGQTVSVGNAAPGYYTDTLTAAGTNGTFTVAATANSAGARAIAYTESTTVRNPTSTSFSVTDQLGTTATGSSAVSFGTVVAKAATINTATVNASFDVTGGASTFNVSGANIFIYVEGSSATTVNDKTTTGGTTVDVASNATKTIVTGFGADRTSLVDLLYGTGGYTTTAQAQSALVSDGKGGSILSLGSGSTAGSIDFAGLSTTAAATHLKVG